MGLREIIIVWAILGIAAIVMLFKWPKSLLGFAYCIIVGIVLTEKYLMPHALSEHAIHLKTIGAGYGAIFGLVFAFIIHCGEGKGSFGAIIGLLVLTPIVMFIIGFLLILLLGIIGAFATGNGGDIIFTIALIGALVGGGGSIVVIIFGD